MSIKIFKLKEKNKVRLKNVVLGEGYKRDFAGGGFHWIRWYLLNF